MYNISELIEFVQRCIDSAENKLASARVLRKNMHFENSVFLYIIAYEEAGKSDSIMTELSLGKEITSKSLEKLSESASHKRKILAYHLNRKQTIQKLQNSNITKSINIILSKPNVSGTSEQLEKLHEGSLKILSRLDNLKKGIFYSDFDSKNKKTFSEKDLESVCYLLDFRTEISIAISRLSVEVQKIKPTGNKESDAKKIHQIPSMKKLEKLGRLEKSSNHKEKIDCAVNVILSF